LLTINPSESFHYVPFCTLHKIAEWQFLLTYIRSTVQIFTGYWISNAGALIAINQNQNIVTLFASVLYARETFFLMFSAAHWIHIMDAH